MIRARAATSSIRTRSSTACASSIPLVPTITAGIPRAQNRRMSAPHGTPATGAAPRSAATAARTRATHGAPDRSRRTRSAAGPGDLHRRVLVVGRAHGGLERRPRRRRRLPHAHADAPLEHEPVGHRARPLARRDAPDRDRVGQRERAHRRMRDVRVDARLVRGQRRVHGHVAVDRRAALQPQRRVRGAPVHRARNVSAPAWAHTTANPVGSGIRQASKRSSRSSAANVPSPPSSSDGTH